MRVLLCHSYYQCRGGEDVSFEQEADLLEGAGHDVLRFTKRNDAVAAMGAAELAVRTVWNRSVARELAEQVRRHRPDVVHFTNTFPLISSAAYYAVRRAGAPVVQALRNYRFVCANAQFLRDGRPCEMCLDKATPWPAVRYGCYRGSRAATAVVAASISAHRLLGTWTKQVDAYYTLTDFARRLLVRAGFPEARLEVKPNFIPRPAVQDALAERRGVLFVGRLSQEKGVATLLDAWTRMPTERTLTIVGDGPLAGEVRQAASRDTRIEFSGSLDEDSVRRRMAQAEVVVLPSLWYETFGRVIVEAFSVGTPVAASRLGAMEELVDDRRTGRLVTPGDSSELARTLQEMLTRPTELAAMGQAAQLEYESRYTPERNIERLLAIYAGAQRHYRDVAMSGRRGALATTLPSERPTAIAEQQALACESTPDSKRVSWPPKRDLFGVSVSVTDYATATRCIVQAARQGESAVVSLHAVHALMAASGDPTLRERVNGFELVGPDGQPVRWALNLLHGVGLRERVYGPQLMLEICAAAAEAGLSVFLYGGTDERLDQLELRLRERFPRLVVAGRYAPPFRPLTDAEDRRFADSVRASGARIVFIGLGAPKQDHFAFEHRERLPVVHVCVGAAFDFHAGVKRMAPPWMQGIGLEWLFRLLQEPRRLGRRYVVTNSAFLYRLGLALLRRGRRAGLSGMPQAEASEAM